MLIEKTFDDYRMLDHISYILFNEKAHIMFDL